MACLADPIHATTGQGLRLNADAAGAQGLGGETDFDSLFSRLEALDPTEATASRTARRGTSSSPALLDRQVDAVLRGTDPVPQADPL
eukprot:3168585-Heterocapsa_arctica.AAC.1